MAIKDLPRHVARFLARSRTEIPVGPAFGTVVKRADRNPVPLLQGQRRGEFADMRLNDDVALIVRHVFLSLNFGDLSTERPVAPDGPQTPHPRLRR
ncbi:hypothetical protein D3C85_1651520 [compost metagenome]